MYERLEACPLCKSNSLSNSLVIKDHAVSNESFALVTCKDCQLLFTNPRPEAGFISKYYQSADYISHSRRFRRPLEIVYRLARYYMLNKKERWLRELKPVQKTLLDVGCGTGAFMEFTRSRGWEVVGTEPSEKARSITLAKGFEVYHDLRSLEPKRFEIITLWHVLEHLHELAASLKIFRKLLVKNGYMVIAIPNHKSYDALHYQQYWAGYDVPRHLYHFSQGNIKTLCSRFKMKLVKIIPLKLDAYYVSILSEKYKNGSIFKAFLNGYRSNQWARVNEGNYSSLVYVLKLK